MEIIDASEVEASGEGLTTAEVNRRATFYVNLGRNGSSRDLKVHITSEFRGVSVVSAIMLMTGIFKIIVFARASNFAVLFGAALTDVRRHGQIVCKG
jgi:hypothetical protein